MLSTQTLFLALAATAAAVDLRFYSNSNCNGGYAACTNSNPNTCCRGSSGNAFASVSCAAIPTNWNVRCRGHNGGNCNGIAQSETSNGRRTVCLSRGPFSGAGYSPPLKRRGTAGSAEPTEEGATAENCTRADRLVLEDGTVYNIEELDQTSWEKILEAGATAATASDMPAEYSALTIQE
ncbi:hypothetical protein MN608_08175 [Microdochium nivale]|nr:hypothetical protein MN608_08175 [Microdochium nivale]